MTEPHDPSRPQPPHRETTAIRSGRGANGSSLAPVLWATSAFITPDAAAAHAMATTTRASEFYSRYGNPTVCAFESAIAEMEGAEAARAFSSGMGAVTAVVLGLLSSGDHIVTQKQLYSGTQMLFTAVCPRFGIDVTFVDATDPDAWDAAIRPGKTMLCFAETPANPRLALVDLERFGTIGGPITVVDSTFATPMGQRPLSYGVNLVLHSATKAIAGHNDATIGVVAGERELIDWLWGFAVLQGANASPFDAMNAIRGLRTLPIRYERQSASAQVVAEFLERHPDVESVAYPGLESHPQHELASRQLDRPGGLITFDVAGGAERGRRFVESTRVAQMATSLGGPETLVTHPRTTTHVGLLPEELAEAGIGDGTIRMSVGLEHPDDIVADLEQALAAR
ncbi:MAG: aminotransferase class I/II-fold pyridoxal phosphate-dependent enzyme [Acidimicrobiales bacterium]